MKTLSMIIVCIHRLPLSPMTIFTSRVSGRGNRIGPVFLSVCLLVWQKRLWHIRRRCVNAGAFSFTLVFLAERGHQNPRSPLEVACNNMLVVVVVRGSLKIGVLHCSTNLTLGFFVGSLARANYLALLQITSSH